MSAVQDTHQPLAGSQVYINEDEVVVDGTDYRAIHLRWRLVVVRGEYLAMQTNTGAGPWWEHSVVRLATTRHHFVRSANQHREAFRELGVPRYVLECLIPIG